MINRNRNSAVDRARAEMKQAVNSSRRQLNCKWEYLGRNNKADVEEHYRDMILSTLDSTKYARTRFNRLLSELGVSDIAQLSYDQLVYLAKEMGIGGVDYDVIDETVEVSSSRHMSYKTRKAVEYSINCARRRARYTGR